MTCGHLQFSIILFLYLNLLSCSSGEDIVIQNRYFRYEIGKAGENLHFIDKTTGRDYLDQEEKSISSFVIIDGERFDVSSLSLKRNNLFFEFGESGIKAAVRLKKEKDRITFKVLSVSGDIDSFTFLNIPVSLDGMPDEPFGACALSMNLFTNVRQIPALQTELWATCYSRFGVEGAEVKLIGLPQEKVLPVIRDIMENADEIPHSDKGGAWALMQKEGYGSYLMNFGTLTEETVDEWIAMCHNLGFNQIDNHGGGGFFKFGDFELNKDKWPDGWETFKRINARLHKAGISSIFHSYAFFIDKNSKYVTPVPSEDLGYFSSFTLAEPLDESSTEITVKESTENISLITGFFVRNSLSLRIGSELIQFTGISNTPPYKFTGCKRGVNGTKPSSHQVNDQVFHLREMFARFVPGTGTALFDEIAHRTAEIVSECDFDGIYFDAIDGSDILGGEENFWYYGTKFIFEVARQLKRPVGMEMSSMSHHWWHYRSRWQAWDRPVRGYKRFIDVHLAAIKSTRLFLPPVIRSNENEHGLWRGHTPLIEKYAGVENGGLLLPLHLGWWGNQTWNPPQIEPTFPDDVEYLCCKMMGNNAGMSMLGGADNKTLEDNPLFRRITGIIKQYEELRHQNYFSDTIRSLLRQPGKEFSLIRIPDGKWNFKPVSYKKHKIEGLDHPTARWTVMNEFGSQPVMLRIEPLMSVKPFNNASNIILTDFTNPAEFKKEGNAEGITGGIMVSAEKANGGSAGLFAAASAGYEPRAGSWIKLEKKYEPWLDLNKNQGLGVWIKGDGNGELLNFRLENPFHISNGARGDHFIKIDFTGWKYFELVEVESSEFSNYIWPESSFYVYDSYRHSVNFGSVDKLQIWYNNLPAGKEVKCLIGTVKALPFIPVAVENLVVTIGNEKITFPVKMEPGMYLELRSASDCKLYGSKGELISEVEVLGNIPLLTEGENKISFNCISSSRDINPRLQVTVISEGKPLPDDL